MTYSEIPNTMKVLTFMTEEYEPHILYVIPLGAIGLYTVVQDDALQENTGQSFTGDKKQIANKFKIEL